MKPLPGSVDELTGLRAARWIRESTTGQFDRYGPEAQIELQDIEVRRLDLVDTGLVWRAARSGRTVYRSSEMAAMLASARAGAFDVLLVGYVSRWQRNLRRTLELLEDVLHPAGVAVYFCDEEILSSSDRHWDQLVDEAKDAERYSRRLARRIREGYASKRTKQADPGGLAPFGFRRNDAKLIEADPELIEAVRRMFELSSVGVPDRKVSELVGVPLFTVRGVLTSPLYVGRLRDGSKAHWPPIITPKLWDAVVAERAKRATNAGRPASPRRPYALDMLYCSACGKRLTGDTGFYRHHDACDGFKDATPEWPASWKGRRDGKAYRRELFEEAIGVLLDRVSVNAAVVSRVVGDVVPAEDGPDVATLRRIDQERAAAASRVLKDRDYAGLQRTMERLDREEMEARRPREREGVPAEKAVEYLQALGDAWRLGEGGPGRAMVARSVFERLEASGFRELKVHLTEEARAHAFAAAIPAQFTACVGYGRGERSRADTLRVFIRDPGSRAAVAAEPA
jgi:DNA invertase Pin-like site-specific DNA recombinase